MSNRPIKILLVEDNPQDAFLVKEMLSEAYTVQFELTHIDRLDKAFGFLARENFDIILLDLSLPDVYGLDTVIQTRASLPHIPIVVMSGLGDEELAIRAVQEGAQDYLVKGQADSNLLIRSIRYAIERTQAKEALRKANEELETRVKERTADLERINRALQESEKKYRILVEHASDGIFILDQQGNIIDINTTACQMLGFTREELLHLGLRDIIPSEDFATVPPRINEILAGEKVVIERRFKHKCGKLISVEISAKMLEDGRVQTIVRDLTERKKAEEALRKSEARIGAIFEAAQDSIFIKDHTLRYVHVNPAMEKLFGLPASKVIGLTDEELFGEEAGKHIREIDSKVLKGEIIEDEHTKPVKGIPMTFNVIKVPIRDSSGEIIGLCGIARDITERKKAEEALRKSETSLSEAQRIAHMGNWDWDVKENKLHWSDEIYRIFGLTPQEFGMTYDAFLNSVHPDDREFVKKAVSEALYGKPYSIDHRVVLPDGAVRIVHERGEVTFGEHGEPIRMLGAVQDITELKKAEEALRESEERYRRMVRAVTAYTYSVEVKEGHAASTKHSLGCLPITGYNPEDYESDPYLWHSMIFPDDRMIVEDSVKEILAGHRVSSIEHRLIRRDGSVVWVRNTMAPHYDEKGRVIKYDGLVEDITERKEAEKALQDSKAKYSAIVEGFDGFIYICSVNHEIEFINERLLQRIGYNAIGQKCYEALYSLKNVCPWCENVRLSKDEIARKEIRSPVDNYWYYIVSTPIYDQYGSISRMMLVQDITMKKENEIRLIMSERLAALGQMASGIAHEINNPLATIATCAEGLLHRMKKGRYAPEVFESYLKIIDEEVTRCKNITTNMLSFVRKTTYEKKEIDLYYILDKTLDIIGFQGRLKKVAVIKNYKGKPIIYGSEGELRQVFLALIVNALDAMEDRGTLTLETGIEDDKVIIKICDTGPGIPSELTSRIFDPFFTTRSEKGGIGLGLSIVNKIIKDHNGNISVTSDKEKGTTFQVTLPR